MPQDKPERCTQSSWDSLKDVFEGSSCPEQDYLEVLNFENCLLLNNDPEAEQEYCKPAKQLEHCADETWEELEDKVIDLCPDVDFSNIEDFQLCLKPDSGSPFGYCRPRRVPKGCPVPTWSQVNDVFKGDFCRPEKLVLGGLGTMPPKYLSVEGFDQCLNSHTVPGSSHSEFCLPPSKPKDCSLKSWKLVRESFDGIGCAPAAIGANTGAPAYLSVPNFQDCLGSHQASQSHEQSWKLDFFLKNFCGLDQFSWISPFLDFS